MILPILLCGGSGTRLWPLSRKSYPKQFVALVDDQSLFQMSAVRVAKLTSMAPVVVTAPDFRFIVSEQLRATQVTGATVIIEPSPRNTAPAVLAAALWASEHHGPETLLLIAPSDHLIPDTDAFAQAVETARPIAANGTIVTFGVKPDRPETGYGYLELAGAATGPTALKRFVEKPDAASAQQMVDHGGYLWNAGIFLASAASLIAAFETHASDLVTPIRTAVDNAQEDLDFLRLDPASWDNVTDISIDYAVMEKAANLMVVPLSQAWSDLGDWEAILRIGPQDKMGVAISGSATAIECVNTLLRSESGEIEVVGLGLKDTIVVATSDAVLVANTSHAQGVKQAVQALKAKGARQATQFLRDHRPWGWFDTLAISERFQVKRIVVKPGGVLSLQSHMHRSEHWIVVEGTAQVTVEDNVTLVSENQSIYVPLGAKHRMENRGKVHMVLIEVQTGAYLGEDDITRYEDVYARAK